MATPAIPQNVYVQTQNGQVLVSWDLVAGATSYSVQRSTDGVTYSTVGTPATNSYLDTAVTVGTQYFYQVAAVMSATTGSYSVAGSVVPTRPGQMTLGQLRLLSQQKADRVNSNFVTLPEWNIYINQSYAELYDLLAQKYGDDYFVASFQFATTGASAYGLPDGTSTYPTAPGSGVTAPAFYKLLGVDLGLSASGTNAWITLKKYEFISRNTYVYPQLTTNLLGVAGMRYRIVGNTLMFIPTPSAGQLVQVWYVPRLTAMLADTDTCDGVSGWTEYIAVDAAIKALQKEESDVSVLMAQKQALIDRIEAAAENRDAGEPETISPTRRVTDPYGYGFGAGDGPVGGV